MMAWGDYDIDLVDGADLTVTITLHEYRDLVNAKRDLQHIVDGVGYVYKCSDGNQTDDIGAYLAQRISELTSSKE